jgi:Flp pilus assembly protein TadG
MIPFGRLLRNERGQVAVWTALVAVPLLVLAGGSVDIAAVMAAKSDLQDKVDSAALAGASTMLAKSDQAAGEARALSFLPGSGEDGEPLTSTALGDTSAGRMTVRASYEREPTFLKIIGISRQRVSAQAVAAQGKTKGAATCVLSLSKTASKAYLESGGSTTTAPNCTVWVNSSSTQAVVLSGGSKITAQKTCVVGTVSQGLSGIVGPPENCGVFADPFVTKTITTPANCDHTAFSASGVVTLQPGVYCNGLTLSGGPTVTLQPGVYVIRNGKLTMSGGGSMKGSGVTFVLEGTATVVLSGGGAYNLVAPKTGQTAGFIFFQKHTASPGSQATISGSGDIYYEGVMYFPTQNLLVSGGGSTTILSSPFLAYIGNTITYTGGGSLYALVDKTKATVPIPDGLYSGTAGALRLLE